MKEIMKDVTLSVYLLLGTLIPPVVPPPLTDCIKKKEGVDKGASASWEIKNSIVVHFGDCSFICTSSVHSIRESGTENKI